MQIWGAFAAWELAEPGSLQLVKTLSYQKILATRVRMELREPSAEHPGTSGRPARTVVAGFDTWSPSTPPAAGWQAHWLDVMPELADLAR